MIAVTPTQSSVALPPSSGGQSTFARRLATLAKWFPRRAAAPTVEPLFWDRDAAFMLALAAVHQGEWALAERELTNGNGHRAVTDARCLNLLGVVYEATRRWGLARWCYGRCVRADRNYQPPQINLRRYYELMTFGRTHLPACLFDEKDVLS